MGARSPITTVLTSGGARPRLFQYNAEEEKLEADDHSEMEELNDSSSEITPIVKGRYAKHREHWNMVLGGGDPNDKYNDSEGSEAEDKK